MRGPYSMTRRGLIGGSVATLASSATGAFTHSNFRKSMVHGRVFDAGSLNKKGLDGVLVSNGVEVAKTTSEGFYSLPTRRDVFIIKPSNWSVPVEEATGLPAFASTHSTFANYKPESDAGAQDVETQKSLDFNLRYIQEPRRFSAALFADPQPADKLELTYLRRAMDKMSARNDFAFGLALGDIASDDLTIFPDYLAQASRLGIPVWHIPGNHDHDVGEQTSHDRLKTWRKTFGPPTYAFEYSGALFIMLDNVCVRDDGSYFGHIGPNGLNFVRNLLELTHPEKLVVVCTHIPLTSSHNDDSSCTTSDTSALLELIDGRKAVSFSGHMHTSEHHYIPYAGGAHHHQVISALSGSWWSGPMDKEGLPLSIASDGTPHGWHALTIDGDDYHTEFIPARHDACGRVIASFAEQSRPTGLQLEAVTDFPENRVLVNVFDGGPRTKVFLDLAGERYQLRRVSAFDPYTTSIFSGARETIKYWVNPELCSHLWMLDMNSYSNIDLNEARLTIVDEYGRLRLDEVELLTG